MVRWSYEEYCKSHERCTRTRSETNSHTLRVGVEVGNCRFGRSVARDN